MRIGVLVKQIPAIGELNLGADGRLVRNGIDLEMSAYCRRAVAKAVELAAANDDCTVTVLTLGPELAEDVLREAIAWGLDRGVDTDGVLITDPAFAGSDTLATARTISAALNVVGPFDLLLTGKSSVDADTGQVPPQIAELLDLPFATAVKTLDLSSGYLTLGCELDDQWVDCRIELPAILSCAERMCDPCKVPPPERAMVSPARIRRLGAAALGPGPWGQDASPTTVRGTRLIEVNRVRHLRPDAPLIDQVRDAVRILTERGGLQPASRPPAAGSPARTAGNGPRIAVVAEPGREELLRELLGEASRLAGEVDGSTVVITGTDDIDASSLASYGADHIVRIDGADVEEDLATAVAAWAQEQHPWAILAGSTAAGREIAGRVAARLGAGLTGDAVELAIDDGRLVAWKPAFGGQLVAAVHSSSPTQMATVRAGVLLAPNPRPLDSGGGPTIERRAVVPRGRVELLGRRRDDDIDILADAPVVVSVGQGVDSSDYGELEPLISILGAELGCTRKVTDRGWMAHARQIGITGRSIAPRLFVMIGASGKFNHTVGIRAAETVIAINSDPDVPAWDHADAGIVGDWKEVVPLLIAELSGGYTVPPDGS